MSSFESRLEDRKTILFKGFKMLWLCSLLFFLIGFVYLYALLPSEVSLQFFHFAFTVSKNTLFYVALLMAGIINVTIFVRYRPKRIAIFFSLWLHLQVAMFNFFFIVALGVINLINSGEKFNYVNIGIIVYGGAITAMLCVSLLPIYSYLNRLN